ncbi:MAG: hypothetical protein M3033_11385 [Acidobacteriota bacterium]|nr:hypothetical protein [Acidobacteriota bacterium]
MNESSDIIQSLGELKDVYRVELKLKRFLPIIVLFFLFLLGLYILIEPFYLSYSLAWKKDAMIFFAILKSAILILPFPFALWFVLRGARDELKIYANGFTYRSRKGLQTCLWKEIKDGTWVLDLDNREKMTSVVKHNSEKIIFTYAMQGLDELNRQHDEETFRQIEQSENAESVEQNSR